MNWLACDPQDWKGVVEIFQENCDDCCEPAKSRDGGSFFRGMMVND
jgi:hypothetical protein